MSGKKLHHRWEKVYDPGHRSHYVCINCGLERAVNKVSFMDHRTYYFRRDKDDKIIEGGYKQFKVPYPCIGPQPKQFLPEDLFEI